MLRISILIVDEHPLVRAEMSVRLRREENFEIVGSADGSASALRLAKETRPCIVLIDPMMRDGSGLETISALRSILPDSAIVVLSSFTDTAQKIELEKLGVSFILNKGIASAELVQALNQAAKPDKTNPEPIPLVKKISTI